MSDLPTLMYVASGFSRTEFVVAGEGCNAEPRSCQ
jgi:hypothetical protein